MVDEAVVPYASIVMLLVAFQRRARVPLLFDKEFIAMFVSGTSAQPGASWILAPIPMPQRLPTPAHASLGFMLIANLEFTSQVSGVSANK